MSGPQRYLLTPETEAFVHRAAKTSLPVLLQGETGTGKTFLARIIHQASARSDGPLVEVGCGGIARDLLERELFGHEKGTFTGADRSMPGVVDAAAGGTLVLNEIESIDVSLQSKILDLTDSRQVRRLGSTIVREVDLRIIATTNRDLGAAIRAREFRQDLYHRFAVLIFLLAPLRERREDIPELARIILDAAWSKEVGEAGEPMPEISRTAMELLVAYDYPGNMRELRAVLMRAAMTCRRGRIGGDEVKHAIDEGRMELESPVQAHVSESPRSRYLRPSDPEEERRAIVRALGDARGVQVSAAKALGMSRTSLWIKMKVHRISLDESVGE